MRGQLLTVRTETGRKIEVIVVRRKFGVGKWLWNVQVVWKDVGIRITCFPFGLRTVVVQLVLAAVVLVHLLQVAVILQALLDVELRRGLVVRQLVVSFRVRLITVDRQRHLVLVVRASFCVVVMRGRGGGVLLMVVHGGLQRAGLVTQVRVLGGVAAPVAAVCVHCLRTLQHIEFIRARIDYLLLPTRHFMDNGLGNG